MPIAFGFTGMEHLFGERIITVGVDQMWTVVREWRDEHNRIMNEMVSSFVERTTTHQQRVYLPGSGTLQPMDQWGVPDPMRPFGYYDVAYPIQGGATAYGFNRISSELATVEELNRYILTVEYQDATWLARHMAGAVLYNAAWVFPDPQYGNLTIQPLANNDAVQYLLRGAILATDNHYLAQAAAIDSTHDPFPIIYDELIEHPSNAGPFACYVASDLVNDIQGLYDLLAPADPEVTYGSIYDRIQTTDPFAAGIIRFGTQYIGRKNRMYVVEWPSLPSGLILGVAHGAGEPLLRMREYPAASLQGLYDRSHQPNEALEKFSFFRDAGFGVHNRVKAVVYQIGEAVYTPPAPYDVMPLAV